MRRTLGHLPLLVTLICIAALIAYGPISQPADYHAFADDRAFLGIPHASDVFSNLGFALVGLGGLLWLWPRRHHPGIARGWPGFALFLVGLVLTAIGSGYYHLQPDNARLFWDRLPIALACAGLLAGVWSQTALPAGRGALVTLVLALYAVASVLWWYVSEANGRGDLRPYLLLQLLPILLIPLWQALHDTPPGDRLGFGAALLLYVVAKVAEISDHVVLEATQGVVSGHTLKHLLATAAAALLAHRLVCSVRR